MHTRTRSRNASRASRPTWKCERLFYAWLQSEMRPGRKELGRRTDEDAEEKRKGMFRERAERATEEKKARCGENGRKLFRSRSRRRAWEYMRMTEPLPGAAQTRTKGPFCRARHRSPDFPLTSSRHRAIRRFLSFPAGMAEARTAEEKQRATTRELYMPVLESCTLNIDFVTWKTTRPSSKLGTRMRERPGLSPRRYQRRCI